VTVYHKAGLSLLTALLCFAGVAIPASTRLFDLVETRLYNPSLVRLLTRETAGDAAIVQELLSDLQNRFAASLNEQAVRRSFLSARREDDVSERSGIFEALLESTAGLQWARFVDFSGRRIYFSTDAPDSTGGYRDYPGDPPFDELRVPDRGDYRLVPDQAGDRIIFAFPFYDSMDVYRGTALFGVSALAVAERLIGAGRIKPGDGVTLVSTPPGIIAGGPAGAKNKIAAGASSIWLSGLRGPAVFDSGVAETGLALVSAKTSQGVFYGRVVRVTLFSFSTPMKALLLLSVFLTVFLALFLLLNLRQDSMTIIRGRLRELQISLMEQFYESKGEMDWARWTMELEQRREGVRAEVKRGTRIKRDGYSEPDVDSLIDKSWDELLALLGGRRPGRPDIDEDKLRGLLRRVLRSMPEAAPDSAAAPPAGEEPFVEAELLMELDAEEVTRTIESASGETISLPSAIAAAGNITLIEGGEDDGPAKAGAAETKPARGSKGPRGLLAAAARKRTAPPPVKRGNDEPERLHAPEEENQVDEFEEAEELEELEELEEVTDPAGTEEPAGGDSGTAARPSAQDIKELESRIEFEDTAPEEPETVESAELEIVSPFTSMLSPLETETILQEPDGIPRINSSVLSPGQETEAGLDQDFKKLVDTVVQREDAYFMVSPKNRQ
jgi:hypothetical protein